MRAAVSYLLWFVVLLTCSVATAQGTPTEDGEPKETPTEQPEAPPDKTPYQRHMDNGIKLFGEANWDGAIAEFNAAYREKPNASPLINQALTFKKMKNPAKAIAVLRRALTEHIDTMPADQREAAEREIREMEALLAWVRVELVPPDATLFIDGREQARGTLTKEIPLSPGTRKFEARKDGYKPLSAQPTIISGHNNAPVKLVLEATEGTVTITANHAEAVIQIEGKSVGRGKWSGRVSAAVHEIHVIHEGETETIHIAVGPGARATVIQGSDGKLTSAAAIRNPADDPKDFGPPPVPDIMRGLYGMGSIGVLTALFEVENFTPDNSERFGAAGALHIGYRVANWAAFEGFAQYSDIRISGKYDDNMTKTALTMKLKSGRFGMLMRIMLPGTSWIRFVATGGLGVLVETLEWKEDPGVGLQTGKFDSVEYGVGPFGTVDLGVEVEVSNVLFALFFQHTLQSTKHFDTGDDDNAFDTKPILITGPALRIGYALW